ncbi:hypothetical protein [Neobacillus sp.]|uniref:hypothetical protein n=1 Tax=Neobacillus sp. TaxID=2675273 RepID=UPI0028987FD7|nr:hypothetical protein [Neobacillus sp.]
MNITTFDKPTLDLLQKAFEIVLQQNNVTFKKIGIVEEGEQLLFLYEGKDEKVHVFNWSKASSINVSIGVLAQSVLMPIIPHLRLLS